MATTTGENGVYDSFREFVGDGTIDLDTDTFRIVLLDSGHTLALSSDSVITDISGDELATGDGYSNSQTDTALALSSVTWTKSGSTVTFDAADPTWTASGSGITARFWAIYDDTAANDALVCAGLLDDGAADVTTTSPNVLTIQWGASGIFILN